MIIAIGSDHAGLPLKQALLAALEAGGHSVLDAGAFDTESVDYPDYAHEVSAKVATGEARFGVLVCGSGIGMSIAANRHPAIRAVNLHNTTEARLTRQHNDANVVSIGGRMHGLEDMTRFVEVFLDTAFSGDERHSRRIEMLTAYESSDELPPLPGSAAGLGPDA